MGGPTRRPLTVHAGAGQRSATTRGPTRKSNFSCTLQGFRQASTEGGRPAGVSFTGRDFRGSKGPTSERADDSEVGYLC